MRLDVYLTENNLCKSRAAAQSLISGGGVCVNGKPVQKNSLEITEQDEVSVVEEKLPRYVGRGGLKLEKALELWEIDLSGKTCLDIGASTGGFTDRMLQSGAAKVFAVDVGSGQLDEKLRADSRVISLEQTDIREFSFDNFEGIDSADFIGTDVSFISLKLILPHIFRLLKAGGEAVALIKPQFEAGQKSLSKKGIVRDEKTRLKIVEEIKQFALQCGFSVVGTADSPITGGSGNIEYLIMLRKGERK
ncbi:MAG: TlyA family RNA methyltransferase [Oscillospiraceae bacterium]|nr:TlyA family RNA methyltransferase [Oscillospiraceae bacterium]